MWRVVAQTPPRDMQWKGNRWVEQVLSLWHTCRLRSRPTVPLLVEAISCLFTGEKPDLS
jgi:hypothetical protein